MQTIYKVTGTLTDNRTVALDEPLPLTCRAVRLVVEPLSSAATRSYQEVMMEIRARQHVRGHKSPTRREVDTLLQAERDSWEE